MGGRKVRRPHDDGFESMGLDRSDECGHHAGQEKGITAISMGLQGSTQRHLGGRGGGGLALMLSITMRQLHASPLQLYLGTTTTLHARSLHDRAI
jgi:hypothetical protein